MRRGPTIELLDRLHSTASAGADVSRLQAQLFWAEARVVKRKLLAAGAVLAAGLASLTLGGPLLIASTAVLVGRRWNVSAEASVALAGAAMMVGGGATMLLTYRWAARQRWFHRSLSELRRSLRALRE